MPDAEGRLTVIQLMHELEKLARGTNGVCIHVQNDVASQQSSIRCRRSDLDVCHDHSALSRQTGNPNTPNFLCPFQDRRRWRPGPLNSYCFDSAISIHFDEERLSGTHLSQLRIKFCLASHGSAVDCKKNKSQWARWRQLRAQMRH